MIDSRFRVLSWLAGAALLVGCAATAPQLEGRPLTPEELEYQKQLVYSEKEPLDEEGRARLILRLDQNLQHWQRTSLEQVGTEDRMLVDNLEEVLQVTVYLNFDDVLTILQNGAPNQRAIAAASLGFARLKEPDDPIQRRRFLDRFPQVYPRAIPVLVALLETEEPYIVQNCLLALWKLGDPDTPQQPLLELVSHDDPEIRSNAVLALSTILTPETGSGAATALINALYDESPKVRNHATTAIGAIRYHNAAGRLAQMLDDQYLLVQANAARALGELGDWRNCEFLIARLEALLKDKPSGKYRPRSDLDQRRDFVAGHLIDALEQLSGQKFGEDVEKWREWWFETEHRR